MMCLYVFMSYDMGCVQGMGLWAKDLADYDVVVTTYEVLRKDMRSTCAKLQSPLLHCQWWRIILDEAQVRLALCWSFCCTPLR